MCSSNILLGLLALIFPPLPVWIKRGLCSADSLINIALCCLGVIPGLLHSWYIIATTPDEYMYGHVVDIERDGASTGLRRAGGRVSYYYVQVPSSAPANQFPGQQQGTTSYGTTGPSQPGPQTEGAEEVPPTYNEAIKGDNKVQRP